MLKSSLAQNGKEKHRNKTLDNLKADNYFHILSTTYFFVSWLEQTKSKKSLKTVFHLFFYLGGSWYNNWCN